MLGICLSGGGSRGASHIGALRALEENGIKPDILSGASAGSIVAGLCAAGMSLDSIEKFAIENADFMDINYVGIAKGMVNLVLRKHLDIDGFIKGDRIEAAIRKCTSNLDISKAAVPAIIIATDINHGKTVYFSTIKLDLGDENATQINYAPLADAIRASLAIPGVFSPKKVETLGSVYSLVDGGIKNNLPFDVLTKAGADKIIGFNLGYNGTRAEGVDNVIEIISQSIDILTYNVTELKKAQFEITEYRRDGKVYEGNNKEVLLLNPRLWSSSLLDMKHTKEMIETGYSFVRDNIDTVKNFIKGDQHG